MTRTKRSSTDSHYLDAFLQGARFALFALEARLRENGCDSDPAVEEAIDSFHSLFQDVRNGMEPAPLRVKSLSEAMGKN